MSDTHTVSVEIPAKFAVTLRGYERLLDTTAFPAETLSWLMEKGMQRGSNDPLGALFPKNTEVDIGKLDEYFTDLQKRWNEGEVEKKRKGGLGRTSDPVMREMKRLAGLEIDKSQDVLLKHHNCTATEFKEGLRVQYLKKYLEDHGEALRAEAVENLAREAEKQKARPITLLDLSALKPKEEAAESEEETEETTDESEEEPANA